MTRIARSLEERAALVRELVPRHSPSRPHRCRSSTPSPTGPRGGGGARHPDRGGRSRRGRFRCCRSRSLSRRREPRRPARDPRGPAPASSAPARAEARPSGARSSIWRFRWKRSRRRRAPGGRRLRRRRGGRRAAPRAAGRGRHRAAGGARRSPTRSPGSRCGPSREMRRGAASIAGGRPRQPAAAALRSTSWARSRPRSTRWRSRSACASTR